MMNYVFGVMIIVSVLFGTATRTLDKVANAVLSEGSNALTLIGAIGAGICFWSGIMRIVEKSNLSNILAKALSPLVKIIFNDIDPKGQAAEKIALNLIANFLGLGNAATPLGISAMQALDKEQPAKGVASNSMIILVVLNTASFQLIPTTTAMLRQAFGSQTPFDILPSVWLASIVSVMAGIVIAKGRNK